MPKRKLSQASQEAAAGGEVDFMRPVFIRSCYAEYYERWMRLVAEDCNVTISGPEGTRTSDFFAYLFQRFRAEHPLKTTVAARFVGSELAAGVVLHSDGTAKPWRKKAINGGEGVFHLYDGTPHVDPYGAQWLTIAPLNWEWLEDLDKCSRHMMLFLPPWTLEELLGANEFLGLALEKEAIAERFEIFGGTPEIVLSTDLSLVRRARKDVMRQIASIRSFEVLKRRITKFRSGKACRHSVLRVLPAALPNCEPATYWNISFLSPKVGESVAETIVDWSAGADAFRRWLLLPSEGGVLAWFDDSLRVGKRKIISIF